MKKSDKILLGSIGPKQHWYPVPYAANAEALDRLVEEGAIVYDPRCEAAMRTDVWNTAPIRVKRNQDGWEALQRVEKDAEYGPTPENG